jgi:hypothetical protein
MMIGRMKIGNDPETYLPLAVKAEDRFKHCLLIGKTGTGKSQLILNLWRDDTFLKPAKILIDPSGFLARDAYSISRGHYCSLEHPLSINAMIAPYKPFQIADIIIETLNQVVRLTTSNQDLTAKMIQILRDEITRCLELGRTTLEEVRANINAQKGNSETRDGILARLDLLVQDDFKSIICGEGSFELNRLIENGESFILDCSGMGYAKKVFIGTLVTNLVKAYFLYSRPKEYRPLTLYIDEAHNFLSQDFSLVLKEGRKYQIACLLATTDFSSIPKPLIHTILSNAGTLVCLRAGFVEASMMSREFTTIEASDIQNLEKYHAAVKTPDDEAIVRLPRPPFVKQVPVKEVKTEKRTFGLQWFDIDPAYSFDLPVMEDGGVSSVDYGRRTGEGAATKQTSQGGIYEELQLPDQEGN